MAVYRKIHLWGEEPRWFSRGERPAPVVQTRHGAIGLAVCYDLEFPELTPRAGTRGRRADRDPHQLAAGTRPPRRPPVLHSLASITAYFNKTFVAVCDRCGTERGLEFEGGSTIAGPDGALRAGPVSDRGGETLHAECDLAQARDKRSGEHNDAFADRRPALYELL